MSDLNTDPDLKPASKPPTPRKPKTTALPEVDDGPPASGGGEVGPLDFDAAGGLHHFQDGLGEFGGGGEFGDYTPSQLYDLNQQLMHDSVPVRPLIDETVGMEVLRAEYENGSAAFVKQIDWLKDNGYEYVRRTRGDGDCFYRSLGFAYVESLFEAEDVELAVGKGLSVLNGTRAKLDAAGIERLVYEDFLDEFVGVIEKTNSAGGLQKKRLVEMFQNAEVSNEVVMFLRLLTSAEIRLNGDGYEGFVMDPETKEPMTVDSFCANVVQAMGKEADNVEMDALCRALGLNVDVAYLNGGRSDGVDLIKFRNDAEEGAAPLVLLYRPGHYDILTRSK